MDPVDWERYLKEEEVLELADEIQESRKERWRDIKPLPRGPEPKREKCHWDYMLEEMQWLAKDVNKERKWKLAQAKKWSKAIVRSNLDVESRKLKRKKEAELERKKTAAWIAKQVSKFWIQVEKLVLFKHQVSYEQQKKKALYVRLEALLGQTETYTRDMAERMVAGEKEDVKAEEIFKAKPDYQSEKAKRQVAVGNVKAHPTHVQEIGGAVELKIPQNEDPHETDWKQGDRSEAAMDGDGQEKIPSEGLQLYEAAGPPGRTTHAEAAGWQALDSETDEDSMSDDDEYIADSDEEIDDMDTFLEEEKRAALEGDRERQEARELEMLQQEQDISLDSLLQVYMAMQAQQENGGNTSKPKPTHPAEHKEQIFTAKEEFVRSSSSEQKQVVLPEERETGRLAETHAHLLLEERQRPGSIGCEGIKGKVGLSNGAGPSKLQHQPEKHRFQLFNGGSATAVHASRHPNILQSIEENSSSSTEGGGSQEFSEEGDDDSYILSGSDEDNEATLEEEERMVRMEGGSRPDEEIHSLQDEANMPIEALLASYRQPSPSKRDNHEHSTRSNAQEHRRHAEARGVSDRSEERARVLTEVSCGEDASKPIQQAQQDYALLMCKHDVAEDINEDHDYMLTSDGEDDESTLEEEERLALAETQDGPVDEIGALQAEASLSVTELLRQYHMPESILLPSSKEHTGPGRESSRQIITRRQAETASNGGLWSGVRDVEMNTSHASLGMKENAAPAEKQERENQKEKSDTVKVAELGSDAPQQTQIKTKVPFLMKYPLREYQHIGLDWLVSLHEKKLNGILADEMGLGKTIQTIALLAHLAIEKGIWGPHLIVVPTSVMLNWEMEFFKFCPAFKVLTYFGTAKERKLKRQGWSKPNSFHVCITTYTLILKDIKILGRKKWKYLILDEAHMIKNWRSQRWQALLNFDAKYRLLLTGTPLQNDLMELWALLHFLMPHVFSSYEQFSEWFSMPLTGMVEGQSSVNTQIVQRLHKVLRPFLLRRIKRDVEKSLPPKEEHILYCRLSKRQRELYEDYMSSSNTQKVLGSGNLMGIMNCLMQLRKVCNHPDLFESRPIVSAFDMERIELQMPSLVVDVMPSLSGACSPWNFLMGRGSAPELQTFTSMQSGPISIVPAMSNFDSSRCGPSLSSHLSANSHNLLNAISDFLKRRVYAAKTDVWNSIVEQVQVRSSCRALNVWCDVDVLSCPTLVDSVQQAKIDPRKLFEHSRILAKMLLSFPERALQMDKTLSECCFVIPKARAKAPKVWCSKGYQKKQAIQQVQEALLLAEVGPLLAPLRKAIVHHQLFFPDRRLIQFDCGKLQELALLLRRLRADGHRCLIFTQMSKMLDVLESFLNLYGYTYLRLDGTTKPEQRQILMQRFNSNPKIFCFILSTRSGGLGMNLTGADTVIFYDSDWNPAMDAQAQDRAHRIGQTKVVHVYRLVSHGTIEENILRKSKQKQELDFLAIQSGDFNTEFFKKSNLVDIFDGKPSCKAGEIDQEDNVNDVLKQVEDEADVAATEAAKKEAEQELAEFQGEVPFQEENETEGGDGHRDHPKGDLVHQDAGEEANNGGEQENLFQEKVERAVALGASWEEELLPVERYAIRFFEEHYAKQRIITADVALAHEEKIWEKQAQDTAKKEMSGNTQEDKAHEVEEPLVSHLIDPAKAAAAYREHLKMLEEQELQGY